MWRMSQPWPMAMAIRRNKENQKLKSKHNIVHLVMKILTLVTETRMTSFDSHPAKQLAKVSHVNGFTVVSGDCACAAITNVELSRNLAFREPPLGRRWCFQQRCRYRSRRADASATTLADAVQIDVDWIKYLSVVAPSQPLPRRAASSAKAACTLDCQNIRRQAAMRRTRCSTGYRLCDPLSRHN